MDAELRRLERAAQHGGPAERRAYLAGLCRIGQHHGVIAGGIKEWTPDGYPRAEVLCLVCRASLDPAPAYLAWVRGGQDLARVGLTTLTPGCSVRATPSMFGAGPDAGQHGLWLTLDGRQTGRTNRLLMSAVRHAVRILTMRSPEVRIFAVFADTATAAYAQRMLRDVPDRMGARESSLPPEVWAKAIGAVQCFAAGPTFRERLHGGRCAIYQDHALAASRGGGGPWLVQLTSVHYEHDQ